MENTSSDDDLWGSGLPCDLARCIGDRLDVLARICFRAVCRSWRAALPAGSVTSIPSPLVLIPTKKRELSLPLRSVVESCGGTSSNPLTLHVVDVHSGMRYVGSSGGWLAVADSTYVIQLVNALTFQVAARLPPLRRNTQVRRLQDLGMVASIFAIVAPDDDDDGIRGREHTIHKVAFSVGARESSYAHSAAALHRSGELEKGLALTFTRAGWDRWEWRQPAYFHNGEVEHFDVAYCQRSGVYYVVTPPGLVWVLDMSAAVPTLEPLVKCHESFRELTVAQRRHAVVFFDDNGDVANSQMYMVIVTDRQEQRVIVQRYTAGEPWSVVSNLGGRALLIANRAQSVAVMPTAASPRWMKPDCVYWMTGNDYAHGNCERQQGMAPVWRFHVPTNTTDMFIRAQQEQIGTCRMLDWHNAIWITPSLT
ncbi:hypothetical protein ACQ4PT_053886 [Festuca glaucescens]